MQEWKKSSARCGADVALSLVRVHCKDAREEKLASIKVLDPIHSPVKDEVAMNVLRLESHVAGVVDYLARLKVAMSRIDTSLWPRATLQNDLESLMT